MRRNTDQSPLLHESHMPYRVAAAYLAERLEKAGLALPTVGVICGSGLSGLSSTLEGTTLTVKYSEIEGFPAHCTVAGHKGEVVFGLLSGVPAMCFRGRFHSYEGHDMKTVVLPVHVMRCLNVKAVIITNAAGGLNPAFSVGDVVCITDHLAIPNLAGKNSLVGPNDDELGPRFPPTSNAYNPDFQKAVLEAAKKIKADFIVPEGTYCFVSGPMYESKSECHFLRSMGGDCVGMSTIPEVVAAHHCGMQVLCLSLITNKVVTKESDGPAASHAEVLEAVEKRSIQMQGLVKQIIATLNDQSILSNLPELSSISLLSKKSAKQQEFMNNAIIVAGGAVLLVIGSFLFQRRR